MAWSFIKGVLKINDGEKKVEIVKPGKKRGELEVSEFFIHKN